MLRLTAHHGSMRRKGKTGGIDQAMATIHRADFLPEEVRHLAGVDEALPIGFAQTNSQPRTVKAMLRLLRCTPDTRSLTWARGQGGLPVCLATSWESTAA